MSDLDPRSKFCWHLYKLHLHCFKLSPSLLGQLSDGFKILVLQRCLQKISNIKFIPAHTQLGGKIPDNVHSIYRVFFSCPEQLNRWPCLSVCLTQLTIRVFTTLQSDPTCDLWDIWSVRLLEDFQSFRRFSDFWETTTATKTILGFVTLITILTIENLNSWQSL